jgi:hypothetical protein
VQVPQLAIVPPQPSPAGPQLMFSSAHVIGTHAEPPLQTPGVPPPPHVCGGVQVPHWIRFPQPSPAGPQEMFCCAQDSGTQLDFPPQTPDTPPPPHVCGGVQLPQLVITMPQPSPVGPQERPWAMQVEGMQPPPLPPASAGTPPHCPGTPPPPHVCGGVHVPQLAIVLPQPSPAGPQVRFCWAHVSPAQDPPPSTEGAPQTPGMPPPPQD